MAELTPFTFISNKVLEFTEPWADFPNTIIGWVLVPIGIALTIQIIWQGYGVMRGVGGRDYLIDVFFWGAMRVFFVVSLGLSAGAYATNVVGTIVDLRESLMGLFTNGQTNIYHSLDQLLDNALTMFYDVMAVASDRISFGFVGKADMTGVVQIIAAGFLLVMIGLYCVYAACVMLGLDISMALLIALGPFFVASCAFAVTATFFNSWLSTILKYVFTAITLATIVTMATFVVEFMAGSISADDDLMVTALAAIVGALMMIFISKQAGSIGGEIIGSAAIQMGGLAKAAASLINGAKTLAKGAKIAAGGAAAAGRGAAAAYGAAQNIGRASGPGIRAMEATARMRVSRGAGSISGSK